MNIEDNVNSLFCPVLEREKNGRIKDLIYYFGLRGKNTVFKTSSKHFELPCVRIVLYK